MREYRKPNLKAPRYRSKCFDVLNKSFYDEYRELNPKYAHLANKQIKAIIKNINGKIRDYVIDDRNGIELPEQLGYIFIGSCPKPKKENPNYHLSEKLKVFIQHRNWESDQYLAKIFYTNSAIKYQFQFSNLWGFSPVRQFSRAVAKSYPENYNKYLVVDDFKMINNIFKKTSDKLIEKDIQKEVLKTYNEFDL